MTIEIIGNKKLEILVIEDSLQHQEMAREQFKDHNLTLVSTFDEAADLISGGPYGGKESKKKFDSVLTDMFLTQGRGDCMGDKAMANLEMPFGYALALMACWNDTPYVAILSDANHHKHPIAYTMDFFRGTRLVGNSRLAILKTDMLPRIYRTQEGTLFEYSIFAENSQESKLNYEKEGNKELIGIKNWLGAINYLSNNPPSSKQEQ